ncbi:MAG: serine hydroxymethyltransferase [bacterium]|nr:serine hydroxymethyltransferase [bacterium]
MSHLSQSDPEIASAIESEINRQRGGLEMIASENFTSRAVIEALGSPLTNKYSEGYPGKRYYSGNQYIDICENLAIERAKTLFGAPHANVQPHSGSQANMAAYFALLEPGDKIMAMNLAHGGHLTHGSPVNFSGRLFKIISYGVRQDTQRIDMDEVEKIAKQAKPKLIVAGFTAYPRHLDFKRFRQIADKVGSYLMVDMAHFAGLVAAKVHPDPVPYADIVTTTTHKTLRGPRGAIILCKIKDRLHLEDKKNLAQKIDSAVFPGIQGGPMDHCIAAKAVCFQEALQPDFIKYQKQVLKNAHTLAQSLLDNDFDLVTGGTDNHLVLLDLTKTGVSGKQAEQVLDEVGIYTNKNMVPYDTCTPFDPSGLRLGTPALTTRGFKENEMEIIGGLIAQVIKDIDNDFIKEKTRATVRELAEKHPLYPGLTVV